MFIRLLIACLIMGASFPSFANDEVGAPPEPTADIEVALIYQKKVKAEPDFESLAKLSPAYINAPDFAKRAFLYREVEALKGTYNKINDKSPVVIFEDFKIKDFSREDDYFSFKDFDSNTHYTYDYNGKTYAVFIRNIDEYEQLPILENTSFYIAAAAINNTHIAAELTLRPVAADKEPFQLYDDQEASLILADLVDIKLIRYESGKVFYHDIASEWKPKSRIDRIVKDLSLKNKL